MNHGPKIATLDIETSPIVAYTWGLFKVNIGLNQILQDWTILSFSAKPLHGKAEYWDVEGQADLRDDTHLLHLLWTWLDESDIIIAQNGRAFDIKKIQARFVQAGMPPPSPFKIVDTLEMAKQIAKFTSNRQDWLSQILTDEAKEHHKEFPGMDLWNECMKGNPRAWAVMKKYNIKDVLGCEKMYLAMLPYYQGHPNVAAYYEDDAVRCPKCGSTSIHATDKPVFTQTGKYVQYQCAGCSGFSRSRYTLNSKAKRLSLLSN